VVEQEVECPFCGERFEILVDTSVDHADYIEDCQVCCRPIHFFLTCEDGNVVSLNMDRE